MFIYNANMATIHKGCQNSECRFGRVSCPIDVWADMTLQFWGLMYLTPLSNMNDSSLQTFLKPAHDIGLQRSNGPDGLQQIRFLQQRSHRIEHINANESIVALPGWGYFWPMKRPNYWWEHYTTGLMYQGGICFWPPLQIKETENWELNKYSSKWNVTNTRSYDTVMLAGGFFKNIWHGILIINTWCRVRHQEDIHFVVQNNRSAPYVPHWAGALGIPSSRILHHDGPIVAKKVLLAPYYSNMDWSCLHAKLGSSLNQKDRNIIVVYLRPWLSFKRNIPVDIHNELVATISKRLPQLVVKTFYGNETFEVAQELFQQARLVVGPHGAGMVNVVFCQAGTPVIEFTTPVLLSRPWQMMGGNTFGLVWWPVLLSNFSARAEILNAVPLVNRALQGA
ncbi:MAG: hypothetical protein J3K34DRAFT_447789 [Monoraphidium minutum]|nr:MAG: hypothetical protein J3K34DRAFT_447789 [Monoraphidium minutum]